MRPLNDETHTHGQKLRFKQKELSIGSIFVATVAQPYPLSVVIRSMHEACVSDLCALKFFPKKSMFMKADGEKEPEDKRRE